MCTPKNDYAVDFWHLIKSNLYRSTDDVVMGCGLKIFPKECAEAIYKRLFPEYFEVEQYQDYEAYRQEMRYLYSQVMTEDELNMHFPRY